LNRLLEELDPQPSELKLAAEYSIQCYKNSNKEIRDGGYSALMLLYRKMGEKLKNYLTDIRKAQMDLLQDGFNEIDGVDPDADRPPTPPETTVMTNIDPLGAKGSSG
jgi:hypothetical protein